MNKRQAGFWALLILCLFFIVLFRFSEGFILSHGDHDCCGEGCPVCLQIQWARNFSRQLRYISLHFSLPFGFLLFSFTALKFVFFNPIPISSVALKVKMNR